jgi:all-trans-8'-apo-beta-carotenal 15,15'-oxygenase
MDRFPSVPIITKPRPASPPPSRASKPRLTRFILDTRSGRIEQRALTEHTGELATINPAHWTRPHRYSWSLGTPLERRAPFSTGLLKVDAETRSSPSATSPEPHRRAHLRPPPEQPRRGRRLAPLDGLRLERHTGELLVLDAADLRTVCRLRMPHHSPLGFHGTWIPAA